MKIYESRNNTYQVNCSYCNNLGHNKRYCPALRKHWEANKHKNYKETLQYDWEVSSTDFNFYRGWSDSDASRRFNHHYLYIKKIMETSTTTTPKNRKAPQCGFCKSKEHTRRNCSHMGEFVKILEETNRAYREYFYDEIIAKRGISIGSYVEVAQWNTTESAYGMITTFDLDKISIGNLFTRWSDYNTANPVIVEGGGETVMTSHSDMFHSSLFSEEENNCKETLRSLVNHYYGISKVIAPAPSVPDKEWFLGQSPAFDWVVKKKSLESLFLTYMHVISKFHPNGSEVVKKLRELI